MPLYPRGVSKWDPDLAITDDRSAFQDPKFVASLFRRDNVKTATKWDPDAEVGWRRLPPEPKPMNTINIEFEVDSLAWTMHNNMAKQVKIYGYDISCRRSRNSPATPTLIYSCCLNYESYEAVEHSTNRMPEVVPKSAYEVFATKEDLLKSL